MEISSSLEFPSFGKAEPPIEMVTLINWSLPLTVSDAIIRKHGGAITAESEPGKGSTFHIYLPVAVSGS